MKLVLIDPHVTAQSPSMRAWVEAFPHVRDLFEEVQVWATKCDLDKNLDFIWREIPSRLPTWPLQSLHFQHRVSRLARTLPFRSDRLIQATGCLVPQPDIRYIHFWNRALLEEHEKRRDTFPLPFARKRLASLSAAKEAAALKESRESDRWWVVSRSLAQKIQAEGASGHFAVLPNRYDQERFHQGVRTEWRDKMRRHYGFSADERILVFSAFGHFERKGLRQAIEAVEKLGNRGQPVRLLVLGGTQHTLKHFLKTLSGEQRQRCVFAGLVESIERHLVAADGLLFPSHFEAFSLAEIEAAALGLRLYLTPHYGAEMILADPANGRWLPWDVDGMVAVLEEELLAGRLGQTHQELGEALTAEAYRRRLRELYVEAIRSKTGE